MSKINKETHQDLRNQREREGMQRNTGNKGIKEAQNLEGV